MRDERRAAKYDWQWSPQDLGFTERAIDSLSGSNFSNYASPFWRFHFRRAMLQHLTPPLVPCRFPSTYRLPAAPFSAADIFMPSTQRRAISFLPRAAAFDGRRATTLIHYQAYHQAY